MKRFRFGLEKALQLRQHREEEAKNELGKAISALNAIENEIKINGEKRSDAVRERFNGINTSPDTNAGILSIQAWDNYILRLERETEFLAEQAAQAELVVEEKRNLYLEASRELKVMEKLKEKRQKEHRKEMFATETKELDDMYKLGGRK
jgi:flagellar FliJ protein